MTTIPNMHPTAAAAAEYVRHGLSLCAIPSGSKGPKGKGWNLYENAIGNFSATASLTGNVGLLHAYCGTMALNCCQFDGHRDKVL